MWSHPKDFHALQQELKAGKQRFTDLVQHYLEQIQQQNNAINAFIEVWEEEALQKAAFYDEHPEDLPPLAGLILGIKDNLCYKGHKVTAASKILEGYEAVYTATALQRLIDKGAIILGRLNCDEFAMGSANLYSYYGPTRHPLDLTRVPGGSSGGSAAAVAAGMVTAALGSDTGGSIRQPAAFCGVIGFKPTYGRISRYGLIAYASSFDQIGPITLSVRDAALLYQAMAGKDPMDNTSVNQPVEPWETIQWQQPPKVAYFKEILEDPALHPQIKNAMEKLIENLKNKGIVVEGVAFPYLEYVVPTYYVLTTAEASSNLARYDGVRYGFRAQAQDIEELYVKTRSQGFGKEVKRRILLGTFVLSTGYYDAYYAHAQKVRRLMKNYTEELFKQYDFIVSPTTPTPAFRANERPDPVAMYLNDIYTVFANLTGIPAISIPFQERVERLPIAHQWMAPWFKEAQLFSFIKHYL